MRFNKGSARGQAAIELILFAVVLGAAIIYCIAVLLGNVIDGFKESHDSVNVERTQTGTIEGKYIDSADYGKHYYVTVKNGSCEADHEVSLAEYNAAQVGADFPIVLTDSDSVKSDEAQEQADNAQADSAKSQAAERQSNAYWQWFWTHQLLTNMGAAGE